MIDPPQIVETATQLTARIYLTIPREEIRSVMDPGLSEIMRVLADQGIEVDHGGLERLPAGEAEHLLRQVRGLLGGLFGGGE